MSWRRGFFRLWIFGSALFVIAVAVINYSEIKAQFDAEREVPVRCYDARGVEGKDFKRWTPVTATSDDKANPFDDCWYRLSKFRPLFPEYKDLSDNDLSSKLYAKLNIPLHDLKNPWARLLANIGFAFGIPLIVLILGAALAWVLSGFKAHHRHRRTRHQHKRTRRDYFFENDHGGADHDELPQRPPEIERI